LFNIKKNVSPENADLFNRFVLFTSDRQIAILFKDKDSQPFAVRKSGPLTGIKTEYQNHHMARALLGDKVPDIWGFEASTDKASFYLEYVPERLLSNVIAESFIYKKKIFFKEILLILDFYISVFNCFLENRPSFPPSDKEKDMVKMSSEIISHPFASKIKSQLNQIVIKAEKIKKPYMVQHGDFCIRNILFGHNKKKILIDWEDMNISAFPLVDYMMLFMSIQEIFQQLFHMNPAQLFKVPELKKKAAEVKSAILSMLCIDNEMFNTLAVLSTAVLCHQNLEKKRDATAQLIFKELEKQIGNVSDIIL